MWSFFVVNFYTTLIVCRLFVCYKIEYITMSGGASQDGYSQSFRNKFKEV